MAFGMQKVQVVSGLDAAIPTFPMYRSLVTIDCQSDGTVVTQHALLYQEVWRNTGATREIILFAHRR